MDFIWDENKNSINKQKHGISFETAIQVFSDPNKITLWDEFHSTLEEEREITIGKINNFVIVFVVTTDVNESKRIISARKAVKNEEALYYGQNRKNDT